MPDNPFANAFNPDRGGLTGFIGGLAGVPTQQQAAGGATANALQELSALKDQGMNNQQALLKWFQTPSGHDFFSTSGPEGLKSLTDGLAATQAPAPILQNVPQGSTLTSTDPQTGTTKTLFKNPKDPSDNIPADVKSFGAYAQIAGLPSAEIKRLALLKIDPSQADKSTAETQAIDELVKNYGLSSDMGEKLKAGVIKVMPIRNAVGEDTGAVTMFDMSSPNPTAQVIQPGQKPVVSNGAPAAGPSAAGTTPETGAATGVLPPSNGPASNGASPTGGATPPMKASDIAKSNPKYFGSKADMFLASGVIPSALAGASNLGEQINPGMVVPEGAKAADRQDMIDTLRSDLASMGQLGGGIGVNKGVLEGYLKLAPTGSPGESPHQAVQKAVRLSEHIQGEVDADQQIIDNPRATNEDKKAASARIQGWNRVQRDLPSPEELSKIEESIRNGTAGAPTAAGAIGTIMDAAGKGLTEVKKQAGQVQTKAQGDPNEPDFTSMSASDLTKVDPRSLSRPGKINYLRRIDALKSGKK